MAGLRACSDQDPSKLRFFWGSLFVAVLIEQGGLRWEDVEPLWRRWRRSSRGGWGRGSRRRGWWREPPFPLPE